MAIALRQTTSGGQSASQTSTTSGTINVPSGDLIVVAIRLSSNITVASVVDSTLANTYAPLTSTNANVPGAQLWYAKNVTGSATFNVTVTWNSAVTFGDIFVWDISGADLTAPLDSQSTGLGNSSTLATVSPFSTISANTIIIGASCTGVTGQATATVNSIFTAIDGPFDSTNKTCIAAHAIVSTIQTGIAPAINQNSANYSMVVAAFKAAAGGGGASGSWVTVALANGLRGVRH